MTDPVSVTSLAITIISKTTEALNGLREHAKRSKDLDIKDQINTLYDHVLELKEVVSRLLDENKELKRQIEHHQQAPEKPKIRQVGAVNYYFIGDEGPYCQPCYDDKNKLVALSPQRCKQDGTAFRRCMVCNNVFYEVGLNQTQAQVRLSR